MSRNTYQYRLRVFGEKGPVQVDFRDPDNVAAGNPGGAFRYAAHQETIERLAGRAFEAKGNKRALSKREIRELGEALFKSLFDKELRIHFLERYHKVVHESEAGLLRLELEFDEASVPHLASLPWEFMRAPHNQITGALWLATAPGLILARTRGLWLPADDVTLAPGETLRIGLAVAAPEGLGKGSYEELWAELEALAEEHDQITLLPLANPATKESIDDLLEQRPHIFHFIGHGRRPDAEGRRPGEMAIVRRPRLARWIDVEQFSTVLSRHRPHVVLLQACQGAAGSSAKAFVSVASQVVRQNVPAVVAMQYEVSNATARRYAREFYRRLAQGKPLDEAAQEGRHEISDFHETLDFAIPVLYMRSRHGQLIVSPPDDRSDALAGPALQEKAPAHATSSIEEPEAVLPRVRRILLECGRFDSNAEVRNIFGSEPKLRLWKDNVPDAQAPAARVDALMAYLIDRFRADTGENGLVLFLQALSEKTMEGDVCKESLAKAAGALSRELEPPEWLL
jgi:hypothetical protein